MSHSTAEETGRSSSSGWNLDRKPGSLTLEATCLTAPPHDLQALVHHSSVQQIKGGDSTACPVYSSLRLPLWYRSR